MKWGSTYSVIVKVVACKGNLLVNVKTDGPVTAIIRSVLSLPQ